LILGDEDQKLGDEDQRLVGQRIVLIDAFWWPINEDDQAIAVEAGSALAALARVALKRSPNCSAIAFNSGVFLAAVLM
jgi:hypothetical protein